MQLSLPSIPSDPSAIGLASPANASTGADGFSMPATPQTGQAPADGFAELLATVVPGSGPANPPGAPGLSVTAPAVHPLGTAGSIGASGDVCVVRQLASPWVAALGNDAGQGIARPADDSEPLPERKEAVLPAEPTADESLETLPELPKFDGPGEHAVGELEAILMLPQHCVPVVSQPLPAGGDEFEAMPAPPEIGSSSQQADVAGRVRGFPDRSLAASRPAGANGAPIAADAPATRGQPTAQPFREASPSSAPVVDLQRPPSTDALPEGAPRSFETNGRNAAGIPEPMPAVGATAGASITSSSPTAGVIRVSAEADATAPREHAADKQGPDHNRGDAGAVQAKFAAPAVLSTQHGKREAAAYAKSVLASEEQSFARGRPAFGISSAEPAPSMSAGLKQSPIPVADMPSTMGGTSSPVVQDVSVPPEFLSATGTAHRAVEAVLGAVDRFSAREQHSVNLQFTVGGADLNVRVELRDGELRTTFRTDSTELRSALANEWHSVSAPAGERSVRLAPPVFTGNSETGMSSSGDGASRREQEPRGGAAPMPSFPSNATAGLDRARVTSSPVVPRTASGNSVHLHTLA